MLPPAGITQLIAVLDIVSDAVELVFISPLVRRRFPFTSMAPPLLTVSPEALFISRLLKALAPEKSPSALPTVCAAEPANDTVDPAPVPDVNTPVLYLSIVPWIVSFLL